jgi:hypothetical protein
MRKVYLSLTGGLGNQLFQLSAALAVAQGDQIVVEWKNARPRLNVSQLPEITEFHLPKNVSFQNQPKFQRLNSKAVGFLTRLGVNPRPFEKTKVFEKLVTSLVSLISIRTFGAFAQTKVNKGVGFCPEINTVREKSVHLIGYFQTYKWMVESSTLYSLTNTFIREPSNALLQLMKLAESEDPLVVHLRFGDYRNEPSFGLLTRDYYHDSILELLSEFQFKSIWVFSDEIEEAKSYLQTVDFSNFRFISDVENSSSQTLEAMRLGKGFVIGNSSFSWWAANLARNPSVPVIAPTPWFIGQQEPLDLIPPKWRRRHAH